MREEVSVRRGTVVSLWGRVPTGRSPHVGYGDCMLCLSTWRLRMLGVLIACLPGTALASDDPTEASGRGARLVSSLEHTEQFGRMDAAVRVVHLGTGEVVYDRQGERAMVPASTTKLVTAAAALHVLGPGYSWVTDLRGTAEPEDGVLDGDLYVVGGGDPTLTTEDLWRLLQDLRANGVERVTGDIVLDDTRFVDDPVIPAWDNRDDHEEGPSYFPGIGALGLDFGVLTMVVRPASEPGRPALVRFEIPAPGYAEVEADVQTTTRRRPRLELERETHGRKLVFRLTGAVPAGSRVRSLRRAVVDPSAYFRAVLSELLKQTGPRVEGTIRFGQLPTDTTHRVGVRWSPSLGAVLMDTNKWSSNFMAETVLRTLGAEAGGEGSTAGGLAVVQEWMEALALPTEGVVVANGSGLSRDTRLSPAFLCALLQRMAADPRVGHEFAASMAIGGMDGTLRLRFRDFPARLRGKTGTLAGVHALAGYLEADDGQLYAYAFLANEIRGGTRVAKELMDDVLTELMAVPSTPPAPEPARTVPEPPSVDAVVEGE